MNCTMVKVEQGSEEWHALRRCRLTASRLGDVMAKPTTKRYQQYQREKVLELLGHVGVEENPEWFDHGRALEPRALSAYEWKYDVELDHNVFLISKKYDWLAASPDLMMLPDYDAGGEIKCRALYKNYRQHVLNAKQYEGTGRAAAPENRHQVQGAMMVTGLKEWWYINYYEGVDLNGAPVRRIHRVAIPRDDALISDMETRCLEFMRECYELAGMEH